MTKRSCKMSFSGKYELESQENFEPFMKAIEVPDELIEKGKDLKSITEIVQNGNDFKITITTGSNVIHNEFTIGQETDFAMITGSKIKSVVTLDGANKLIVKLNSVTSATELSENKLLDTLTIGDLTYKRISKRI
ncbi:fatty acid-binding protein 1, liver-like [Carcharodon carcharias]|uniref:fatty acid-binding protein 1, liver-like n=1 Tax=Carcharodon carcharias TaxID=13397 RepID=UPI001B7E9E03|nr:fatty acid-binding protein 1, liver-like [Carcharodon carcharias]